MSNYYKPILGNIAFVQIDESSFIPRHVVCAANKYPDGLILVGVRHSCPTMRAQLDRMDPKPEGIAEQGFIDQWGNWMGRDEALFVVKANNQPLRYPADEWDTLYSENLY